MPKTSPAGNNMGVGLLPHQIEKGARSPGEGKHRLRYMQIGFRSNGVRLALRRHGG